MRMLYINGTLTPTVADAVTVRTGSRIYDAVAATGSWSVIFPANWENGIIDFDKTAFADEGDKSPLDFIDRLNDMLWRVGLTELGLTGEISAIVTGDEPCVFRVIVENSELRYQKASLTWQEPVTP
jgi:hypothetical protein